MIHVTVKGLLAHKLRLVTTSLAIVIGVSFMAGTLVLTNTVTKTFNDLFSSIYAGTDAVVRADTTIKSQSFNEQRAPTTQAVLDAVKQVDGVIAADGNVQGYAQLVGKDGKAIGDPARGAPTYGQNWPSVADLNPYQLAVGNPPRGPDDVVVDKASADKGGFTVGDTVTVLTQTGKHQQKLTGIVTFGEADSPLGASIASFTTPRAQELVGKPGEYASISVVGAEGLSQSQLVARIKTALPSGYEAITGEKVIEESQTAVAEGLGFFNTFMLVFALIALFVGSFLIYNTFSIIVAQRTKELALLRALGAGRGQVVRSVLLEAVLTGVVASGIGLVVGIAFSQVLKGLLAGFGFDIPSTGTVISPASLAIAFTTGLVITVVSAVFPARRAAKVPPIAAMRDVSVDRTNASVPRIVSGAVVLALGVGSLLLGLFLDVPNRVALVGLGAAVTFLGVAVLGPVFAKPVADLLGRPLSRLRGVTGALARENASRNPKRTSATAAALMVGVGLVAALMVLSSSAKSSINETLDKNFTGDFVIDAGSFGGGAGGLSPELAAKLRTVPDLSTVSEVRFGEAEVNGEPGYLVAVDPGTFTKITDLGVTAGSTSALDQPNTIAVATKLAKEKGWTVGQQIPAKFGKTGSQPLTLVATYDKSEIVGSEVTGLATYEKNYDTQLDFGVYTTLTPGADPGQARRAIEAVAADYPTAKVADITEYKKAQTEPIDQIFSLMYVLLFLAIVIALLGIANTIALSIYERTRELGLLRAVGMSRRQLRSTVRWESAIIGVLGSAVGIGIGLFFGWAIVRSLAEQGFTTFVMPVGSLVAVVVLAAVGAVLFSLRPARRAAKLDVLQALATE